MNQAAADLAAEIKAAQLAEFGPDPGQNTFPSKFFDSDIYVYQGNPQQEGKEISGTRQHVNPGYCATAYGASLVSALFGGAAATPLLCPLNPAGLQFDWRTTKNTPYCIFARGTQQGAPVNAAFLLDYFTHGYPGDLALQMAQAEVDGSFNA